MIPVMQSRFGRGNGNCLLACVASVLHRPLESIPDFAMSGNWFEDLYEWCRNENIGLICIHPKDLDHSIVLNSYCIMIFTVAGIADENHAVIGRCRRIEDGIPDAEDPSKWKWQANIIHDPNPLGVKVEQLEHLLFLCEGKETNG